MAGLGRHLINLDLFTDAYRVTGRVAVGSGGIMSELSNPNSKYLDLEDAYVSRIHEPGKIVSNYTLASFHKDNINFIVLQDRRDGLSIGSTHGRSIYNRGRPTSAFLTVPSFEIKGEVLYDGKPSPSSVLVQSAGQFHPIYSAQASASVYPDISYTGDLILVLKDRIGIFCLQQRGSNNG